MAGDPFYKTKAWHVIRKQAILRDGYTCQMCGVNVRGKRCAHVDHIKGRRKHPNLALHLPNLQTLCTHCHNSTKQAIEANDKTPVSNNGFLMTGEWIDE